ncbi:MAG: beta-L-arabinofuranosidase domain-containing protein [Bacteroidales bacterium]
MPSQVKVEGLLGQAVDQSQNGRLLCLPGWNEGQLIKIFSQESRLASTTYDWYGEHAGKWLYTMARAAFRTNDAVLKDLLFRTADYLVSTQEQNGYLGTYSLAQRITNHQAATHENSWDVWNMSYIVLGLLEVNKYFPNKKYLQVSKKIGELFLENFGEGKQNITGYGTRRGISATVVLDPVVELYRVTGDKRYLDFSAQVISQMEEKDGLHLISDALANRELEWIGDGKIYQLLWNITAVAKLYQLTGNNDYLIASENIWNKVHDYHLTITGGPWGGIGKHKECFNSRGYWSPYGYIETCSVMAWIQFNREMLKLTGEARYTQEIERSAFNSLLGAQYPNGMDWCYHSFTNGATHMAHFNDCCPSSGALALEELPPLIYSVKEGGIACNIYAESTASLNIPGNVKVMIIQHTDYPFDGQVKLILQPEKKTLFKLYLRIPEWAKTATIKVNNQTADLSLMKPNEYFIIERTWKKGDIVEINFPLELKIVRQAEVSNAPQRGGSIYQLQWFALTRGPLSYAVSGLLGGEEREEVFLLTENDPEELFIPVIPPEGLTGPAYELRLPDKPTLLFLPFFEASERKSGTWRLTWVQETIR